MKFGMLHFFEHPPGGKSERQIVREQLDCMCAAEDMGFDSIWAPEHHSSDLGQGHRGAREGLRHPRLHRRWSHPARMQDLSMGGPRRRPPPFFAWPEPMLMIRPHFCLIM